jgi:hypothetical protein
MSIQQALEGLFTAYLASFKSVDIPGVQACYHLPCTLNTPEKLLYIESEADFFKEFEQIFKQLKQAAIADITASNSSYSQLSEQLFLVNIDWHFIDSQGQVFADFTAVYHILVTEQKYAIVNVVSVDLSSALSLAHPFNI